jgi:hypothetical protein
MIYRSIHSGIFARGMAWLAAFIGFHYNGQRGHRSNAKFVEQDRPLRALNEMVVYIIGTITAQGGQIKKFFS